MKQIKGKDAKVSRQGTNEKRIGKKKIATNIKAANVRGEFDEEKLVPATPKKKNTDQQ